MVWLTSLFLIGPSAGGKFAEWEGKDQMFEHLGYTPRLIHSIGILEVTLAVLLLIPRLRVPAALLLTAYLGGAVATHLRVGDPFLFPIGTGLFMWIGVVLGRPHLRRLFLDQE